MSCGRFNDWLGDGLLMDCFFFFFAFLFFRFFALILNILRKYYPLGDVSQLRRKPFFAEVRRKKNWITNSTVMALFEKGLLWASTDGRRVRHAVLIRGSQCTKTECKCLFCNTDTKNTYEMYQLRINVQSWANWAMIPSGWILMVQTL